MVKSNYHAALWKLDQAVTRADHVATITEAWNQDPVAIMKAKHEFEMAKANLAQFLMEHDEPVNPGDPDLPHALAPPIPAPPPAPIPWVVEDAW